MGQYKNIILGIDIHSDFYKVFKKAINIAKIENSKLFFVSALSFIPQTNLINITMEKAFMPNIQESINFDLILKERKLIIKKYVEEAKKLGIKKIKTIIDIDSPKNLILSLERKLKNCLIILGNSTKNNFQKLILGSNAKNIVNESHCDILIIK